MKTVPQSLVDYLTKMITPPEGIPDRKVIWIPSVGGHDFTQYEPETLHGVLFRGKLTDQQTKDLDAALRPGAYVLAMTDDDDKTGHRNAILLEDQGLEIRDTIVVLEEGMDFYYGGKAPGKERNAGCHHLKQEARWCLAGEADDETAEALEAAGLGQEAIDALLEEGGSIPESSVVEAAKPLLRLDKMGTGGNHHPTLKPVKVLEKVLKDLDPSVQTVLDPFCGSGSMGIAALATGHDYTGIEMNPEYLTIADARLQHWISQQKDFRDRELTSEATRPVVEEPELFGF